MKKSEMYLKKIIFDAGMCGVIERKIIRYGDYRAMERTMELDALPFEHITIVFNELEKMAKEDKLETETIKPKPMKQKSLAKLQTEVDQFNSAYPVGSKVNVKQDSGQIFTTEVLRPGHVLEGHSAVGYFEGIRGCYSLSRVVGHE